MIGKPGAVRRRLSHDGDYESCMLRRNAVTVGLRSKASYQVQVQQLRNPGVCPSPGKARQGKSKAGSGGSSLAE